MSDQFVKVKGVADIVFVIDNSGSMRDIISSLNEYVAKFVDTLLNDKQSTLNDVRLGLVTHDVDCKPEVYAVDFMNSASDFRHALMNAPSGATEYGLPAIDRALDFNWRNECRRYIVFISDEPVSGGHDPSFQNSKLKELAQKMSNMHVHFIGFNTEDCSSYSLLGKTAGSTYTILRRNELSGPSMNDLLMGLAKTVTAGVDSQVFTNSKKNLYNL